MASSLRTKSLNAKDIKTKAVPVPMWDCTFEIRGLTGAQRADLVELATVKDTVTDDKGNVEETSRVDSRILNPLLIIASCFDPETGEKVYEDGDAQALEQKSAEALDILTTEVLKLNGMTKDETKALEKNSGATDTAASASA